MIVIYGGRIQGLTFANDIYVYNVVTHTWQAGPPGLFRVYVACTVSGNQLLVWGGIDENSRTTDPSVIIFNINTMAWTDRYSAPASPSSSPVPRPSNNTNNPDGPGSDSKGSNLGAIIGGSVGGLAVLLAAVLLGYFFQRRRERPQGVALLSTRGDDDDSDRKRGGAYPDEAARNDEELQQLRVQLQTQQEELELHRRLLQLQQEQQQIQQQQQQRQQQAAQYLQQAQSYQAAGMYAAHAAPGPHDPFRNISGGYSQDTKNNNTPVAAGSSSLVPAVDLYNHSSSMVPPNSPPIYAAHPYRPHILPSPTPSHTLITDSTVVSATNSNALSRANSFGALNDSYGEGSSSSSSNANQPRGYKSGAPSNPQLGARER